MSEFSIYAASIDDRELINKPIVVSWWAGAGYKDHADRLIESLSAWRNDEVGYLILRSDYDRRGWEANCARKPQAVLAAMNLYPNRSFVWLDADATVVRRLMWHDLFSSGYDLTCLRPRDRWPGRVNSGLLSGTLAFASTSKARKIVEVWAARCAEKPGDLDQDTLLRIVDDNERLGTIRVKDLDPRYVCIPDLMPDVANPIVIHHQASRSAECRFIQ